MHKFIKFGLDIINLEHVVRFVIVRNENNCFNIRALLFDDTYSDDEVEFKDGRDCGRRLDELAQSLLHKFLA